MDTTDPEITFDEKGQCNHCRTYYERSPFVVFPGPKGESMLKKQIEVIKKAGRGKRYDCLIGLSGGIDSSYVAYLVKKHGLRPLAVHFDSGWNSEQAVRNIENIVQKLEIDLFTDVCDWPEMQDLQLSYIKAGVINADIPMDQAFMTVLYRIARQQKIRYLIAGHNYETEAIMPSAWVFNNRDSVNLKAIQKRFGRLKLKRYPLASLWERLYTRYFFNLTVVPILNFGPSYNKEKAMKVLEAELGWQYYGGKHYESVFTRFYQGYYLIKRFNVDKRKAHLSSLICSHQLSREEALEELKKPAYPNNDLLHQDLDYIPKKLGISRQEFDKIMEEGTRSHYEFPNENRLKHFVAKLAAFFSISNKT
jgi:N-acetyl sugar amidotransferase